MQFIAEAKIVRCLHSSAKNTPTGIIVLCRIFAMILKSHKESIMSKTHRKDQGWMGYCAFAGIIGPILYLIAAVDKGDVKSCHPARSRDSFGITIEQSSVIVVNGFLAAVEQMLLLTVVKAIASSAAFITNYTRKERQQSLVFIQRDARSFYHVALFSTGFRIQAFLIVTN